MLKRPKVIIGIAVTALVVVVGGIVFVLTRRDSVVSGEWKTYRDKDYGFEMRYPPEWEPRFWNGRFAGFYDASYEDWLESFHKSVRVTYEVIDFGVRRDKVLKEEGVELTLEDYARRFYERTNPNSENDPVITRMVTDGGLELVRKESYSTVDNPPRVYVNVYVPLPNEKVLILTTIKEYSLLFDEMVPTLLFIR